MAGEGYALAREELIRTLTAYSGITTADGASDYTSLICSDLIGKNDYLTGKSILIMSGDAQYETTGISAFDSTTGEITFGAALSAQIVAGVSFRVLNVLPESIHIKGYDYESGEWRKVRVTGSGEIAIHVTVADIVTAKISGQSVVVTSGQVDVYMMSGEAVAKVSGQAVKVSGQSVVVTSGQVGIKGYDLLSGEWRPIVVNESGELAIHITVADIVTAKISGETVALQSGTGPILARISGDVVKISGEAVEISGEAVRISGEAIKISGETVVAEVSGEQVRLQGFELVSGDWRNILVNASGQIIARISGDVVKISGETVALQSGTGPILAKVSGETVIAKVSGQAVKVSGQSVVVTSGQLVAKVSGQSVVVTSGQVAIETPTMVKTGPIRQLTDLSGGQVLHSGAIKSALVKALTDNSGVIAVGGATDRPWYEAVYSGQGLVLDGGEAASLDVDNFDRVYVVAEISGEHVSFLGVN